MLVKELQSLALDIRILDRNYEEIDLIKFLEDDDDDTSGKEELVATMEDRDLFNMDDEDEYEDGMTIEDVDDMDDDYSDPLFDDAEERELDEDTIQFDDF